MSLRRLIPLADRTTHLYRSIATDGQLLYVGITYDWRARFKGHAKSSEWWTYAHHVEIFEYPNRATAFAAESWAIANEHPIFNLEPQSAHVPDSLSSPSRSFSYVVRRFKWNGDEIPPKEVNGHPLVQGRRPVLVASKSR